MNIQILPTIIKQPTIFRSLSNTIYHNLALENYLFQHAQIQAPVMFLWQNNSNIVIGRHQNPWKECFLEEMKQNGVLLSRRKSGGGAVYQDLGNQCFTFINPVNVNMDPKTINNEIILQSLREFKIDPVLAGRNDIHLNGKKISGSAYQLSLETRNSPTRLALHHGTMLLSCNFGDVSKYLNPNKKKLISKGVDSVVQRIMNLIDVVPNINRQVWEDSLIKNFREKYEASNVIDVMYDIFYVSDSEISEAAILENSTAIKTIEELTSWEWLYQYTPQFSNNIEEKFSWGLIDIYFDVKHGTVESGKVFSDSLFPDLIETLNETLNRGDIRYDQEGMKLLCSRVKEVYPQHSEYLDELNTWLGGQI